MCFKKLFLLPIFLLATWVVYAQECPTNIGFEDGTFTNWKCFAGSIDASGNISLGTAVPPVPGRHTVIMNTSPQARDPYGDFPVNCPNGSKYSIQLGNAQGGAQAEGVTYTYTIPADKENFALVYYYAVVLQSPNHAPYQQPAFQANIRDISPPEVIANTASTPKSDLTCGNHVFTASAGLPGFQVSKVDKSAVYKDWSPVVINLVGYQGHTIELNFITNDCTFQAHWGYAYLDFNDICDPAYDGLIVGNKFCTGSTSMTLNSPAGFETYTWYDESMTNKLGTDRSLKLDPIPPEGTKYNLVVTPYPGLGCTVTLSTEIKKVNENFNLQVQPSISNCKAIGVDLTAANITAGSSAGLKYEYYTDPDGQNYLPDPKLVNVAGTYYIRGTNDAGCTAIAPIQVSLLDEVPLSQNLPVPVCSPQTIDLTQYAASTEPAVIFKYYTDLIKKTVVPNPKIITTSGRYYIEATSTINPLECVTVKPVDVIVSELPVLTAKTRESCPPFNLTTVQDPETAEALTYTYFYDAAATQIINDPAKIITSGTYYYQAKNGYNCPGNIAPIIVTIDPPPEFKVNDPAPVVFPETINLIDTHIPLTDADFTYWKDAATTIPLDNYQTVGVSGTFYIKAINEIGRAHV